jgi:hypothetical protein
MALMEGGPGGEPRARALRGAWALVDRPIGWIGIGIEIGPLPAGSRSPACRAARASIGGPGVLPSLCFGAALPRDAGAAIQNPRLPRRGHRAQGDNAVMGERSGHHEGHGEVRGTSPPLPVRRARPGGGR